MPIKKVSIEAGCISCSLCMDIAPDVFDVPEGEDCVIRPGAAKHFKSKCDSILLAAGDCPVEVIAVEEDTVEKDDVGADDGRHSIGLNPRRDDR